MTRQEWFNTLTPEVQEKFRNNTNATDTITPDSFFEFWLTHNSITPGIGGAFVFARTPEGFVYWNEIDEQARKLLTYEEQDESITEKTV